MILVLGNQGQLARAFADQKNEEFVFLSKSQMDFTNPKLIAESLTTYRPRLIINCAAYTAVDLAEINQDTARIINADALKPIGVWVHDNNAKIIHFSTDYVFDGSKTTPWNEDDPCSPANWYGHTKLMGEKILLDTCPNALIFRITWLFSEYGNNFVKTMLKLMAQKRELSIVADQHGCPTYAGDVASVINQNLDSMEHFSGVFHLTNLGITNWFNFAQAIYAEAHKFGLLTESTTLIPIASANYPTPAKRPAYSALNTQKFTETFGTTLRPWQEGLHDCLARIKKHQSN